jgi:putative flippase GtrA
MTMRPDGAMAWARTALTAGGLPMSALRFAIIGVLSSLVFTTVTATCVSMLAIDHKLASTCGYLVALPLNFIGNRRFSFRSSNGLAGDAGRFLLLHAGNLIVTVLAMGAIVDLLGLHYSAGIVAAVIIVPVVNFLVMQWWVFRPK